MNISFIGLGIMGSRMARNLLKHGQRVTVFNRSEAPILELKEHGAVAASSYKDCVQDADVVFTMLSTPEVVEKIALGPDGFIHHMREESIWVDCSTVNPSFTYRACRDAHHAGIRFIDAPVAGTLPHAERAQLTFFVGAPESDLERVEALLEFMGSKVIHVGSVGKGAAFKMLVNTMLGQAMVIFSETLILGEKMGLDKDFLLNHLPELPVSPPFTKFKASMIRDDDYPVMFPLEWMQKDMHLVTKSAYEVGQPLYLANLAKELFMDAKKAGMGRMDFAAIHRYLEGTEG